MGALLHNLAVPHDQDAVGLADGGKAVRHHKAGVALHHLDKRLLNLHLGAGVDRGGCLVEDQHRGLGEHGAGDAQQLLLPLRDVAAVLGQDGVVALRQAHDEAVGVGRLGCRDDLLVGGVRLAVGDVVPHRAVEHPGVLQHHAVQRAQGVAADLFDRLAVHPDLAGVDVIEAHQQVNHGRLAAAGRADQGDALAGLHVQVKVADKRVGFFVGEVDPLDIHPALAAGGVGGVGVVRLLGLLVDDRKDALGAGQGGLQLGDDAGNFIERLGILVGVGQKAGERADGKAARDAAQSADQRHRRVHHAVDKAGAGVGQRGVELRLDPHIVKVVVDGVKLLLGALLIPEGLDHLLLTDQLLDAAAELALDGALLAEHIKRMLGDKGRHKQRERGDDDHHQPHLKV